MIPNDDNVLKPLWINILDGIVKGVTIRSYIQILFLHWIRTHPQTQSRLIVSCTIVVHTCFLIKFLRIKEIRGIPRIVALLDEHFAERNVFDVLRHLAVKIGDVATAAQVVRVVVELHLLVVVVGLEVTIYSPCACHRPCLCRLRRTVVAAEALTIHIVVIVLTIIRLVKRLVVVFNGLQLLCILILVVNSKTISLITCIRYSSWVCLLCSPIYTAFLILLQIQS